MPEPRKDLTEPILEQVIHATSANPILKVYLRRLQSSGLWGLTILEVLVQVAEAKLREIDAEDRRERNVAP